MIQRRGPAVALPNGFQLGPTAANQAFISSGVFAGAWTLVPTGLLGGPTDSYQFFVSTGVNIGVWVRNPTFLQNNNIYGNVLPLLLVDQDRAYAVGAAHDYDVALLASTEYAFSIVVNTNDAGGNRRTLRYMCDVRRVAAAAASGVNLVPVQTDATWTVVAAAVGNNLRITLTNATGALARASVYADALRTPNVAAP